jgi:RNA polymerase sigma-70 factor, ECF subfamily
MHMTADMDDASKNEIAILAASRADRERALLSDALVKTGSGDKSAFEYVYRKTSAKLFGVCLRIFPERAEAEEALQDAFINIWNRAGRYEPGRASPISWLVAVTRNRAIDRLRAQGRISSTPIEEANFVADTAPLADVVLEGKDENAKLNGCIETLDSKDAGFIRAAFLNGMTYAELAVRETVPLGTVKSRIRRALIKLRNCLGGES